MARSDKRYREAYNHLLDFCAGLKVGDAIPSEKALCEEMAVSRTVVRRCLSGFEENGLISWEGREKRLLRLPQKSDRLDELDGGLSSDDLEQRFFDWILRFDVAADTPLSVAELSRTFNVPQHELKEFLAGLSRFGLVTRRRQGGWMLRGFTKDFAVELSDFRSVLELNAIAQLLEAPVDHAIWKQLEQLRAQHVDLARRIDKDFHEFSKLDEAFHRAINSVVANRFTREFQKVISLIFHYHYLWNKAEEKERNAAAIEEHLAIIDALEARDEKAALKAARAHLRTSKTTLLSSLRYNELG